MRKLLLLLMLVLVSTSAAAGTAPHAATKAATPATTYTRDTKGQLASKTLGGQTTRYAFNALHQLINVTLPDGTKIDYTYGPDGNIAGRSKTPPDGKRTTTHYLVDPTSPFAQIIAEYDDAGHATATFVYGDELLGATKAGKDSYYQHDGHGSVVAVTDAFGVAIQSATYDAWGNPVERSGADDDPHGYAGERRDVDTGLIYLRARWYDPAIGRFVSADPGTGRIKEPITSNRYVFADADPVNRGDPSGKETLIGFNTAVNVIVIGSTAIHAGFHIAEGDYKAAATDVAVGVIALAGANAGPAIFRALGGTCARWCTAFYSFSRGERLVIAQAKAFQEIGLYARAKAAVSAGEELEVAVGDRIVKVSPTLPGAGMTLFPDAFVVGPEAVVSEAEFMRTLLHELYRLQFQADVQAGAAGAARLPTDQAFDFARRAYELLFR